MLYPCTENRKKSSLNRIMKTSDATTGKVKVLYQSIAANRMGYPYSDIPAVARLVSMKWCIRAMAIITLQ